MAKGNRTGKGYFQKGQSGNPKGRAPLPEELRKIQKLSPGMIKIKISKYALMDRAELELTIKDRTTPSIDVTICSILAKAMQEGDYTRLNFLLDRSIGKVKDNLEVTMPKPMIIERLDGSQLQLGHEKIIDVEYEEVE